jgi:hypothetical protein
MGVHEQLVKGKDLLAAPLAIPLGIGDKALSLFGYVKESDIRQQGWISHFSGSLALVGGFRRSDAISLHDTKAEDASAALRADGMLMGDGRNNRLLIGLGILESPGHDSETYDFPSTAFAFQRVLGLHYGMGTNEPQKMKASGSSRSAAPAALGSGLRKFERNASKLRRRGLIYDAIAAIVITDPEYAAEIVGPSLYPQELEDGGVVRLRDYGERPEDSEWKPLYTTKPPAPSLAEPHKPPLLNP